MKLVFMGTPEFAVPSLKRLHAEGHDIVLVVTNIDKPRRGIDALPEPTQVKKAAMELGLPVFEIEDLKDGTLEAKLRAVAPDVIAVVAFRILPPSLFSIPTKGIFNLHASLLPKYRGAAPINWAIIGGETETGVTTFFLQEKVDTGNIILQKSLPIAENEVFTELSVRLAELGATAVAETIQRISNSQVTLVKQDDSLATKAQKLTKENTRIDWNQSAKDVVNFIRGLSERPTAWTMFGESSVKIYRAALIDDSGSGDAGKWHIGKDALYVDCQTGMIEILSMQVEGKKRMRASDFLRGYRSSGNDFFL
jgi:methionyl-tRNA formyltransferase